MRIAIVDDFKLDRDEIERAVLEYLSDRKIVADITLFENGEKFMEHYLIDLYDIVISDIYMNEISGIDLAKSIRQIRKECKVLFVTSSVDFVLDSYEVQATYYLLKPIDKEKLEKALDLCFQENQAEESSIKVISNRISIDIPLSEIYWCETIRNALYIHLKDKVVKTYMTFHSFCEMLKKEKRFLKCNKGCIVNMDYIHQWNDFDFILLNEDRVQVRKRGGIKLKMEYMQYTCGIMMDRNHI